MKEGVNQAALILLTEKFSFCALNPMACAMDFTCIQADGWGGAFSIVQGQNKAGHSNPKACDESTQVENLDCVEGEVGSQQAAKEADEPTSANSWLPAKALGQNRG